jgi:acetyl esterase
MVLHPESERFLATVAGARPIREQTPAQARAAHIASAPAVNGPAEPVATWYDRTVDAAGGPVRTRVYLPARHTSPGTLLYFHGGGWLTGTLDTYDPLCRSLANRSGLTVVSVDYRLAPEHPHPAAVDDAQAVLEWVAAGHGGPDIPAAPLAVAGDSAGGNLAAVLAVLARNAGRPQVAAQVLVYPITDAAMNSRSYRDYGAGFYLTADDMAAYWDRYAGRRRATLDPAFSPLHTADLSGLPPALVMTAEYDPLRDEGEHYAERLRAAGVPVRTQRFGGLVHGFFRAAAIFTGAGTARDLAGEFLRGAMDSG